MSLITFGSALFPFDADVHVFRIFAEDDDVHALGMLHGRGHSGIVLHGTDATVEIEDLAQGDVEGADAASDGGGQRAFDGDAKLADGADGVVGKPVVETGFGFLAGEDFVPGYGTLAVVGFFDGGIENANGGFPDIAASAVAFNERDDRVIGNACTCRCCIRSFWPWDGTGTPLNDAINLPPKAFEERIIINFNGKGSRVAITGKCDGNHGAGRWCDESAQLWAWWAGGDACPTAGETPALLVLAFDFY